MTTNTSHPTGRRLLTFAAIVGVVTTASAGLVFAESGRSNHSTGRGGSYSDGDTTGAHHIDPMGYMHRESDPLKQAEQDQSVRDYYQQQNTGNNTYGRVGAADGSGWVVCKAQARWCK
jgi:hypothetical protein